MKTCHVCLLVESKYWPKKHVSAKELIQEGSALNSALLTSNQVKCISSRFFFFFFLINCILDEVIMLVNYLKPL